jgi:hypothetical protein
MHPDRNHSAIDAGQPTERQPLLSTPRPADGHPDRDAADNIEASAAEDSSTDTLLDSRMKLGASALNFFLSGIAMAAVGVSMTSHTCVPEEAC